MLDIVRGPKIKCDHCGREFYVSTDCFTWDSSTDGHEYGMGVREEYQFEALVACEECDSDIEIRINAEEYAENIEGDPWTESMEELYLKRLVLKKNGMQMIMITIVNPLKYHPVMLF